jgi:hypothetical protein
MEIFSSMSEIGANLVNKVRNCAKRLSNSRALPLEISDNLPMN